MKIKAAVCHEFGAPLTVEDVMLMAPARGQVRVDLKACAICHSDLIAMDGGWGGDLPAVFGHEAAGIVTEVGEGVTDYALGDTVLVTLIRSCGACGSCSAGHPTACEAPYDRTGDSPVETLDGQKIHQGIKTAAFAEAVVVDQSQLASIPADLAMDAASLLSCGVVTGLGAVTNAAKVPAGASVVVIGTGGVGLNTVQGAHLVGASCVIAVDVEQVKLDGAMEFGATHGVMAGEGAAERIREITGGGADYVFVTVGVAPAIEGGLNFLAPRGELVMVGMTASGQFAKFEPVNVVGYSQVLRGTNMGETVLKRDIPYLVSLYQQGRLKLDELISNRYSLDQINEAIADTRAGKSRRNVIVFE